MRNHYLRKIVKSAQKECVKDFCTEKKTAFRRRFLLPKCCFLSVFSSKSNLPYFLCRISVSLSYCPYIFCTSFSNM